MTPFGAWTGEKPNVEYLRTFRCATYARIPKDERQKLDSEVRKCIFLGYTTEKKGYLLYDPERGKVIHSRDTLFNESNCGLDKELDKQEHEKNEYVELDCLSDKELDTDEAEEPEL